MARISLPLMSWMHTFAVDGPGTAYREATEGKNGLGRTSSAAPDATAVGMGAVEGCGSSQLPAAAHRIEAVGTDRSQMYVPTAQGNEWESLKHDGRNWQVGKPFELSGGTRFACYAVVPCRQSAVSGPSSRENRPPCLRPVFLGTPPRAATASKLVRPGALSVRKVVPCSEFRVRPLSAAAGRV